LVTGFEAFVEQLPPGRQVWFEGFVPAVRARLKLIPGANSYFTATTTTTSLTVRPVRS
jgi:hypothetical protein